MTATPHVPFVDLAPQWNAIRAEALPDIDRLFASSAFIHGPWVERFEADVAAYLGVSHAIGVGSGTAALHLAWAALGYGPGDKVLVPSHTFVGSVWGLLYAGIEPVLCDVDPATGLLDLTDAAKRCDAGVRAILAVHLYGKAMDMDAVHNFARSRGLRVVEDAAQAIGATHGGQRVGGLGDLGCFSFYPGKNLGAAGDAGLVVTPDADLAARVRKLRNHAQSQPYLHDELGFNYRMDALQALVLGHKLPLLERWTAQRRDIARRYATALADLPLVLPANAPGHVFHLYVVRTNRRDALRAALDRAGIRTGLHYPVPLHRQPCLDGLSMDRASFPASEIFAQQGVSLPLYAGMTTQQQDRVIDEIRHFFAQAPS